MQACRKEIDNSFEASEFWPKKPLDVAIAKDNYCVYLIEYNYIPQILFVSV